MNTCIAHTIVSALALAAVVPPAQNVCAAERLTAYGRIVLTEDNRVLRTAATELQRWLNRQLPVTAVTGPAEGDVVLTRVGAAPVLPLIRKGLTDLHNAAAEHDAFHILEHEHKLWIIGSSWRGVMQGVNELILSGTSLPLERRGRFAFRYRIFSPLVDDQLFRDDFSPEAVRQSMRYLSLVGASHVAVTHDFSGLPCNPHRYIASEIFPKAGDPAGRQRFRSRLRLLLDAASDYGLAALYDAKLLPCQGGPWMSAENRARFLEQFPAEVLSDSGTYQGKVLCFGHPQVQAFYKDVFDRFIRDFPEIELFHYLCMDANAEFCDPESCPRCRGLSKFAQRDRLSRFLAETMGAARPGLLVLNTSFQWDRPLHGVNQLLARQAMLPSSVGLCMSATGDSATFDRQAHEALRQARAVTAHAGQLFVGRDAMHFFEDMPFEGNWQVDYPFGIFAKIQRWQTLAADGFCDVRGRCNRGDIYANSLACRDALLNPAADPKPFVRNLARRWFGPKAAPLVILGWSAIERGQAIRSTGYSFPSSSALSEYVPWHLDESQTRLPLPANPKFTAKLDPRLSPERGELVPTPGNGWTYHAGSYPENLQTTGQSLADAAACFREAAQHLEEALAQPLPERIPDTELWLTPSAANSPKDYLRRHLAYVRGLERLDAFMGCHFVLKSLFMRVDGNAEAYRQQGEPWLKAYRDAARSLADYVEEMNRTNVLAASASAKWSPAILRNMAKRVDDWLGQ